MQSFKNLNVPFAARSTVPVITWLAGLIWESYVTDVSPSMNKKKFHLCLIQRINTVGL